MQRLFTLLKNLIRFSVINDGSKKIVFYCEGSNYWTHFEGLILETLKLVNFDIIYLSSDPDDPGLKLIHPRYHSFDIGDGHIRSWVFQNLNTCIAVMTTPDLETYQLKKSNFPVHYVYIQHSLVSLHMAYGQNAFDAFDTIFCAGPHHANEVIAIEKQKNISSKIIFHHGYSRLDQLINLQNQHLKKNLNQPKSILFAPSWGENGIIESGKAIHLIRQILDADYPLIFRPHPQTMRYALKQIKDVINTFKKNKLFTFESNVSSIDSLLSAKLMISDWSGAALEFGIALGKPVIFIDIPKKINNPSYQEIPMIPFEESIRFKIGKVVNENTNNLKEKIFEILHKEQTHNFLDKIYNVGISDKKGAEKLIHLVKERTT